MTPGAGRWASVAWAAGVTAAIAAWIVAVDAASAAVPGLAGFAGALVALAMLAVPLLLRRALPEDADPWGVGPGRSWPALALGLWVSLAVLAPATIAYDQLAMRLWRQERYQGEGLPSRGQALQGEPPAAVAGTVAVWERGGVVVVRNDHQDAIVVAPTCAGCAARTVAQGQREVLASAAADGFVLLDRDRRPLDDAQVRQGRYGVRGGAPYGGERSLLWLLALLLDQLVLVALPEEALFRGLLLGRLRRALPPRHRLLGTPFGLAHVVCAALFAVVHLAATPSAHRLLVFFPGLLFCWLAERARHVAAPVLHHALANVWLQAIARFYG